MSGAVTVTERTIAAIRALVVGEELPGGSQIRQEEVAARLGVSRSPLREALRALESEGLVYHAAHRGYFVTRLSAPELQQVYLMRRLLEGEVLRSIGTADEADIDRLNRLNRDVRVAARRRTPSDMLSANRRFHEGLFALSPLDLVVAQVRRLWNLSHPYQATYLWLPDARHRVVAEHEAMIEAVRAGDRQNLVKLADAHRAEAEATVMGLLAARSA
jgi:DNA-binding GntR family transcriptional regulator